MAKPIFIVFSDIHIHNWKQHNNDGTRLKSQIKVMDKLLNISDRKKVPLLFAGDILQSPDCMSQEVFSALINVFNKYKDSNARMYMISGNHDMNERYTKHTNTWVNSLSSIYPQLLCCIDHSTAKISGYRVQGVPFYRNVDKFVNYVKESKADILMIHQELPGASDNNGFKVDSVDGMPRKLKALFGKFELVICGHIHKRQELGNNILFPGAPMQQRTSDSTGTFGYYKVYKELDYKFVELKTPKFRFYTDESEIDNDYGYWVKIKGLKLAKEEISMEEELETTDRSSIARKYLKHDGIKDKKKKKLLLKYL